jgi:deazaflavin-dependent oxidoreductase (nitroreductase family)
MENAQETTNDLHETMRSNPAMIKKFEMTNGIRIGTAIFSFLLRLGVPLGPIALLTVRGRKSGKAYSIPIGLLEQDGKIWLVAVFGAVSWVHNVRATGTAQIKRGLSTKTVEVIEIEQSEAVPLLKEFLKRFRIVPFFRPYFTATWQSPLADFEREAPVHPVFILV